MLGQTVKKANGCIFWQLSIPLLNTSDMSVSRLLFVDDDRLVLATIAKSLRDAGYAVTTADSGEAALATAQAAEQPFDLAVLDISMPGLSGIETAKRLQAEHGMPAMFLSAYGEREMVEQAANGGGLGFVVKPADGVQLVTAIESALARARAVRQAPVRPGEPHG